MKNILKKILFVFMLSAVVLNFSSCGDDDDDAISGNENLLIGDWWCEADDFEINIISFYKDHTGYLDIDPPAGWPYEDEFEFHWSLKDNTLVINELGEASIKSLTEKKCIVTYNGKRYVFHKYGEGGEDDYYYGYDDYYYYYKK
ncbi:MAG: hypothetical protein VZQ58_03145 [Bacteroidales bacterium]|jgi:hypothetical protein|nr:hypothetical protein [Bacteroidales bacterium]MBQ6755167.1 hypothetical protein [Bacteroidales bacterium]MDY6381055.1 hypothetical protein [Bacteroidales bacterium]MDY6393369.1 hypothetical protein [Bacteroidales bacterium]MEE3412858.1 hypothetical protein [Bacteroidales bacterium]